MLTMKMSADDRSTIETIQTALHRKFGYEPSRADLIRMALRQLAAKHGIKLAR